MPNSLRKNILDDLAAALLTITKANGYNFNMVADRIIIEPPDEAEVDPLRAPYLYIQPELEPTTNKAGLKSDNDMQILITGYFSNDEDIGKNTTASEIMECLLHDIRYAINQKRLAGFTDPIYEILNTSTIKNEFHNEYLGLVGLQYSVWYTQKHNAA